MKSFLLLVAAVLAVGRTYAEAPCANVYIYNGTVGHASPADILAKADIERRVNTWPGLCFKVCQFRPGMANTKSSEE